MEYNQTRISPILTGIATFGCSDSRKTSGTKHLQIRVSKPRLYHTVRETYVATGKPSVHFRREHILQTSVALPDNFGQVD